MPPIVTMALGSLPQSRLKSASGLFNLMRNLGGAIGIAVSATMLNDRLNFHYLRLNEHVSAGQPQIASLLDRQAAYWTSWPAGHRASRREPASPDLSRGADAHLCGCVLRAVAVLRRRAARGRLLQTHFPERAAAGRALRLRSSPS